MSTADNEGPAWGKFWLSLENESESMLSGEGSHRQTPGHRSLISPDVSSRTPFDRVDSVQPNDSASHHGDNSRSETPEIPELQDLVSPTTEDTPFPFKFKAPSGRVHRLQVIASEGMAELIRNVTVKLGPEIDTVGGEATFEDGKLGERGYALSYLDNEGDTVSLTTDRDLLDAIVLSRQNNRDKVDLFVHDPKKPPVAVNGNSLPGKSAAPFLPSLRDRRGMDDDGDSEDAPSPVRREQKKTGNHPRLHDQLIPGISNELLLPGAVVTLAVVIIGVFALSRPRN